MTRTVSRSTAVVSSLAGVTGVFLMAGCSAQAPAPTTESSAPDSTVEATVTEQPTTVKPVPGEVVAEGSSTGKYADGTYTAEGSYSPQAGLIETIEVTITLEGSTITAVDVQGNPQKPESVRYQGEFIGGIADVVVGKPIDDINVSRVAGSSLTSGGFNQAVEAIKAEAAA